MSISDFLPALNLMTLVVAVLIAAIGLALFLRKKSNRHPMDTPRGKAIERERAEHAESQKH